jgi:ElaB/YqjD/DUF883 family membrane-anchored ribosome-binding protein
MSSTDARATASTTNSGAGGAGGDGEAGGAEGGGRLGTVRQSAAEAYESARERTASAYQAARERAGDAYESARDTARNAGQKTAQGIDSNPMAALVGGLALGAIAAALLPRTEREEQLLGAAGRKVTGTARDAANAARDAARQQIDELGLSKDGVQRRLSEFTDKAVGAVKTSAGAASGAVKNDTTG